MPSFLICIVPEKVLTTSVYPGGTSYIYEGQVVNRCPRTKTHTVICPKSTSFENSFAAVIVVFS